MDALVHKLKSLGPTIVEICRVSGTPGVSLGVLHKDEVIHIENYGYRDVERKIAPDQDTLYFIASLSKIFTAAAIGILVHEKKLEWSTPVSSILPDFDHPDATIKEKAALVDFLSHRSGLAAKNQMWFLEFGRPSLPRGETMRFCSYLDVVHPFGKRWLYNNWGYGLADEVTEKLAGKSWGTYLRERIFDPLGMESTTTKVRPDNENIAKAYIALSNGTPYEVPRPQQGDGKLAEGAAGVQSNVRDLLTFYKTLLIDQQNRQDREASPLKNISTISGAHVPLEPDSDATERSYAMGLVRTLLPGSLGVIGLNPMYVNPMPTVGKGLERPQLCIYHEGSIPGHLSSAYMLPETNTAIVVLTNSMAKNDAADWIGQLLLETVLDNQEKNDYVALAEASAKISMDLWPKMREHLETRRVPNTTHKPLGSYVGVYWNLIANWCIEVFEETGCLKMCFQQQRDESYELHHYHYNTFSWLLTRDEDVRKGRFPVTDPDMYLMDFRLDTDAEIGRKVVWKHDPDVPNGEIFSTKPLQ